LNMFVVTWHSACSSLSRANFFRCLQSRLAGATRTAQSAWPAAWRTAMTIRKSEALAYHLGARPGKIEVTPTKPCRTQRDLSLAYTPGVAEPSLKIAKDPGDAYKYTAKGNLVAVVSNGTAVLGLGNIGALAGKPVMKGKGVLFKRFADVDVFDLEVNSTNPDDVIKV
jgi:malate dehydrogenase (oxaloacetate-decarboxylating)(NADP+)